MLALVAILLALLPTEGRAEGAVEMLKLLNDGTEMPMLGLGTWKSPKGEVEVAVRHALCKAGYRHVDAAQIYQNQEEVGRGIHYAMEHCGLSRRDIWVTSKIWNVDFHESDIPNAVTRILQELNLTYVDQLLLHWPTPYEKPPAGCPPDCPARFSGTDDPQRPRDSNGHIVNSDIPLWKTWKALETARDAGHVRSIGVSNFQPEQIDALLVSETSTMPAVNQVEAHVFWNQARLREALRRRGVALVAYSPLGNPAMYADRLEGMRSSLVADIAGESGMTEAQVMLGYLLAWGDVVIPKSVTPARISSNAAVTVRSLTDAQVDRLSREAPQSRLANPPNLAGGRRVFQDTPAAAMAPPVGPYRRRDEL